MYTVRKILGKRGRTTIPYELRQILDMRAQDVITFSINDDKNCVVITKEKICDASFTEHRGLPDSKHQRDDQAAIQHSDSPVYV